MTPIRVMFNLGEKMGEKLALKSPKIYAKI